MPKKYWIILEIFVILFLLAEGGEGIRFFNFSSFLIFFCCLLLTSRKMSKRIEILLRAKRGENFEVLLHAKRGEYFEILLRAKRGENLEILFTNARKNNTQYYFCLQGGEGRGKTVRTQKK